MQDLAMAERVEKLGRRRARMMSVLAVVYLAQQYSYFSAQDTERTVDHVRIVGWAVSSLALLAALISGGGLLRGAKVRALLNDESTRAHRADALGWGFVVAMLTAIILYIFGGSGIAGREAVHLMVSFGIATALLRFGLLERRAMRGD